MLDSLGGCLNMSGRKWVYPDSSNKSNMSEYTELRPLSHDLGLTKFDVFVGDNGDGASVLSRVSDVTSSNCSSPPNVNMANVAKVETIDFTPNQDEFDDLASIVGLSMGTDALLGNAADSSDLDLDTWIENTAQSIKPLLSENSLQQILPQEPTRVMPDNARIQSLLLGQQPIKSVATSQGYSILQNRLQHGPMVKMEEFFDKSNLVANFDALPHSTMNGFISNKSNKSSRNKSKKSGNTNNNGNKSEGRKMMHYCHICHRGFLNKSNIKVHLRTHTGEKPFKCQHCTKSFRQKAHLLKHMSIHKRISRD